VVFVVTTTSGGNTKTKPRIPRNLGVRISSDRLALENKVVVVETVVARAKRVRWGRV